MASNDAEAAFDGPSFSDLITDGGWRIFTCWGVTWAFGLMTLVLWLRYHRIARALDDHYDPLRSWYMKIVFLGQVWAVTTGLSVAFVRAFFLFQIFEHLFEALTLCCLHDLTVEIMGRKANFVATFQGQKAAYYGVFPLGGLAHIGFLRRHFPHSWFPETELKMSHLNSSHKLTRQAYYVIPIIAVLQLLVIIMRTTGKPFPNKALTLLSTLQVLSIVVSVYGVLIVLSPVWKLEHMAPYRLKHKFAVVKVVVILGVLQGFLIQICVAIGLIKHDNVLTQSAYTAEVLWANMLLAIESPFLLHFASKYYPPAEVVAFYDNVDSALAEALRAGGSVGSGLEDPESAALSKNLSEFARDRLTLNDAVALGIGFPGVSSMSATISLEPDAGGANRSGGDAATIAPLAEPAGATSGGAADQA